VEQVFVLCFFCVLVSFLFSPQTAIAQTNSRRAKSQQFPFHPDRRTFANFPTDNGFFVGPTISKNDQAGNTRARLNHQFALFVPFDALLNLSRNVHDRADKLRQAITRRLHIRTAQSVGNRL
jgi:hypothetical protein